MIWPLAIITTATAAIIAALHWLPWNRWLGHELQPPWNYTLGVTTLLIAFVSWIAWAGPVILPSQPWMAAIAMTAIAAAGGITDVIAYHVDRKAGDRMYRRVFGGDSDDGTRDRS